jgi:hypothetical protein
MCAILPLNWPILDNAQARSAVALRSYNNPFEPSVHFHHPVHILVIFFIFLSCASAFERDCIRACNPPERHFSFFFSSTTSAVVVMGPTRRAPSPSPLCHPLPQRSPVNSLRNSDMLPILRKAQFKGPCGRLLLEQSQILPIDSGESPPFSLTSPLNFMRPR